MHACCPAAAALGITPGTAVAHARALVPDLEIRPADLDAERSVMARLAVHAARHWTPTAAVCEPLGLWMDVTGVTHLFGGEERFCRRVVAFLARIGLTARIALADTPGAAHALARFGAGQVTVVPVGRSVEAIAGLPVASLRLGEGAIAACRRFGLDRVVDILAVPRAPLTRRLGRDAVRRLDQAIRRVAEPIEPVSVEEAPTVVRRLLEPIVTHEAIGQVIGDVAGDLAEVLRRRGIGVRALRLRLLRVDGDEQVVAVGTARATRDAGHLAKLMRLRIDRIDPGMGIEEARLVAKLWEPLGAQELEGSLAGDGRPTDISPLIDRIAGRLGRMTAFRTTLAESDVPERCVVRAGPLQAVTGWPAWARPSRLLPRPEALYGVVALLPDHPPRRFGWRGEVHDVVAGDGPERIHGEWWVREGEVWAVRDYYRVEDRQGRRFWIFRRGDGVEPVTGDLSWWMHGAFG